MQNIPPKSAVYKSELLNSLLAPLQANKHASKEVKEGKEKLNCDSDSFWYRHRSSIAAVGLSVIATAVILILYLVFKRKRTQLEE